jgi:hypothetical protein
MLAMNGKRIADALGLLARRSHFGPDDRQTIIDGADELLAKGGTLTRAQNKMLDVADNLRVRNVSDARMPTPFDAKIEEAAAAVPALTAEFNAATAKVNDLRVALGRAGVAAAEAMHALKFPALSGNVAGPTELFAKQQELEARADQLREELVAAEADLLNIDSRWLRANSRHVSLKLAADRWIATELYSRNCVK